MIYWNTVKTRQVLYSCKDRSCMVSQALVSVSACWVLIIRVGIYWVALKRSKTHPQMIWRIIWSSIEYDLLENNQSSVDSKLCTR